MRVKYNMVIDFARPSKTNTVILSEDDSNSRLCHFTLLADKKPLDMTGIVGATIEGRIGSTTVTTAYGEVTILEDEEGNPINEIEYLIPGEFTKLSGTMTATIELQFEDAELIRSFEFYIVIRNSLYDEDFTADLEDINDFKEIVRKTQAALNSLEADIKKGMLPNPEPLVVQVDGTTYEYFGDTRKEIYMGHAAYLAGEDESDLDEIEVNPIDESYANASAVSAAEAAQSASDAKDALDEVRDLANQTEQWKENAKGYYEQIDSIIPTVSASKDPTTGISHINVTSLGNSADTYIKDGTQIDVEHEYDNGVHTVTMKDTLTDEVLTQFDITEPQGSGLGDMLESQFVGEGATKRVHAADNLYDGSKLISAQQLALESNVDTKFNKQMQSGFLQGNLIPYPYFHKTQTTAGVTTTDNGDGTLTVKGKASTGAVVFRLINNTQTEYIPLEKKKYILQWKKVETTSNPWRIDIGVNKTAGGTEVKQGIAGHIDIDNTNGVYTSIYAISVYFNVNAEADETIYPMLVEVAEDGSYPTEYIPYSGLSNRKLTVYANDYDKQIDSGFLQSKNLFDKNTLKLGMWGGEVGSALSFNADVSIYVSSDIIEVKPNTTYYVGGTSFNLIFEVNSSKNVVATQSSRTFTTSATTKYIAIRWRTSSISEVANSNVQVEVGDVPTDYVEGNGKSNRELTKEVSDIKKNNTENASAISCTITGNKVIRNNNTVVVELEIKTSATSQINLVSIPYTLPVTQATLMITNSDGTFYSVGYATANGHIHSMKILNGNSTYVISGSIIAE